MKEHLVFQAKVRMDRDIPFQQRMERVETVMVEVKRMAANDVIFVAMMMMMMLLIVIRGRP